MKYKESLVHFLVFITSRSVITTAIVIVALIILHPTFMRVLERMRMSSAYDMMQRIAQAQVNYNISHGRYSKDFTDLDLKLKDKYGKYFDDDTAQINNFTLILAGHGILATQNKGEYFVYYDYRDSSFSCAPREHYICKNINSVPKNICEEAGMLWSVRNNSCYTREKDLCLAVGMPWNAKDNETFCGYKNTPNMKIAESAACIATKSSGCQNPVINKGGVCLTSGSNLLACNKATINNGGVCRGYAGRSCNNATVFSGGICEANAKEACQDITVKKGGRCIANIPQTCNGTYEDDACCHGDYCPEDSPKCNCPGFAKVC